MGKKKSTMENPYKPLFNTELQGIWFLLNPLPGARDTETRQTIFYSHVAYVLEKR